jgi:hypothetical protein
MSTLPLELRIHLDGRLIETRRVAQDVVKIGRLPSSQLRLDDDAVARMHAVIEVSAHDVRLVDLGSSSGTIINGARVDKHAMLQPGDTIEVGPYAIEVAFARAAEHAAIAQRPAMAVGAEMASVAAASPVMPRTTAAASRPHDPGLPEVEVDDGTSVAEVIATYGGTVLDVQHIGQARTRRKLAPALIGAGALMTIAGAALFASEVGQDWDAYNEALATAQAEGRPAPQEPGTGLGSLGAMLALLGLVPMVHGASRRETTVVTDYTVGESSHVSFPLAGAGLPDAAAFPIVRTVDGQQVLSFASSMEGEVAFSGHRESLQALARDGRARATGGGAFELPIPRGARCRLQLGEATFLVSSVAPGRAIASRAEADKPFWAYTGGTLAVVGGLLALSQMIPSDELGMDLDDLAASNRFVGYIQQPDLQPEPEPTEEPSQENEEPGGQGERASGAEGKMGDPTDRNQNRAYAMKKRPNVPQGLARNFSMDRQASEAGILGLMKDEPTSIFADASGTFASGTHDEDVWGNLQGTEIGSAFGLAGKGLVGTGRGGGGDGQGIGMGDVGLIGWGSGGGDGRSTGSGGGLRYGRDGAGFDGRKKRAPAVRIATGTTHGALDKDLIRRVVRAHINEVRHCYNQGLSKNPNLAGRVSVQFQIGGTGKVAAAVPVASSSTLDDVSVQRCVAQAVKRWSFPKASTGGTSMVTYPFVFSPG